MRITENMTFAIATRGQARSTEQLATSARVAATGLRVSAPSDDPMAYAAATRAGARLTTMQSRGRVAARAGSDLDAAETALASAGDLLIRARELAVDGSSDSMSASDRASIAHEVDQLRQGAIGLANTRGAAGYLFSGTRTDVPAFDAAGAFQGNDTAVGLEVGDATVLRSNASGASAFTAAGGRDVFADLQTLATALASNNGAAVRASIDAMDGSLRQLVGARVDVGLRAERLHSVADVATTAAITISGSIAADTEADAPAAYSQLMAAQTAYQRSLAVTRQLLSMPTLAQM